MRGQDDIRSFEDLACWREARQFCLVLLDRLGNLDQAPFEKRFLGQRILEGALGILEGIAGSFSVTERGSFLDGLRRVLAGTRSLETLLLLSRERGVLNENESREVRSLLADVSLSVKEHVRFLAHAAIKESYRDLERI